MQYHDILLMASIVIVAVISAIVVERHRGKK